MFISDYSRLSPSIKKSVQDTFNQLNKVDWNIVVFIPKKIKKIFQSRVQNNKVRIVTIPSLSFDFESSYYLELLAILKMPPPKINVCVTSTYIGIICGSKNIRLLGVDNDNIHSFKTDQITNETYTDYIHFSKSRKDIKILKNKFNDRKPTSMYIKLKREASVFKWYAYISIISKNLDIIIKNKSSYSLIDSFKR